MNENNQINITTKNGNLQMISLEEANQWYTAFVKFSKELLKDKLDYGTIPGVSKPSLFKAGAEKLRVVYGFRVEMCAVDKTEDYNKFLLDYTYKATVKNRDGDLLAECEGNANSYETKYRYIWLKDDDLPLDIERSKLRSKEDTISEFDFAISKAETSGKYGKPLAYWQKWKESIKTKTAKEIKKKSKDGKEYRAYEINTKVYRAQNEDIFGSKNTLIKMAQKRAFVGAILIATGASEFFTQDLEDLDLISENILKDNIIDYSEAKFEETEFANKEKKDVKNENLTPEISTKVLEIEDVVMSINLITNKEEYILKYDKFKKYLENEEVMKAFLNVKNELIKRKEESEQVQIAQILEVDPIEIEQSKKLILDLINEAKNNDDLDQILKDRPNTKKNIKLMGIIRQKRENFARREVENETK